MLVTVVETEQLEAQTQKHFAQVLPQFGLKRSQSLGGVLPPEHTEIVYGRRVGGSRDVDLLADACVDLAIVAPPGVAWTAVDLLLLRFRGQLTVKLPQQTVLVLAYFVVFLDFIQLGRHLFERGNHGLAGHFNFVDHHSQEHLVATQLLLEGLVPVLQIRESLQGLDVKSLGLLHLVDAALIWVE